MPRQKVSTDRAVYIVDGARTPFLKARSTPGAFSASDLAVSTCKTLLARQSFKPSDLGEVIAGCMMPSPDEANIGRIIALRLGCGDYVPGWTVQRNCASGLQAIDSAAQDIIMGRHDLVLAGGTEAMSHAPLLLNKSMVGWLGAWSEAKGFAAKAKVLAKLRPGHIAPVIALLRGLTDPLNGLSMGQTAEILAYRFGITREQMDEFAMTSHLRAAEAQDQGYLSEITPAYDNKGNISLIDDGVRRDSSMERLAKLKPFFDKPFGMVTAGNSSQVTDGAAFVILASADAVKQYNLPILGRIVDTQWSALNPAEMGLGPVHAITPLLKRHDLKLKDIDYWEINEAFAAQVLACLRAWEDADYCRNQLGLENALGTLDTERLNVDGGAIALGHPVGASGARLVLHLLHLLRRKKAKRGIASLCIGGGQGGAMLLENVTGVE